MPPTPARSAAPSARWCGATAASGWRWAIDGRLSSPELAKACVEGLTSAGIDVIEIGLAATPMLYFAVWHFDADGGIQITGSHNPPDFNGFKMMMGKKSFFGADIQKLGEIAAKGDFETGKGKRREEAGAGRLRRAAAART